MATSFANSSVRQGCRQAFRISRAGPEILAGRKAKFASKFTADELADFDGTYTIECMEREAKGFDPYYSWLGIPPDEQPPDHYRLLGIRQLEANPDVIANAADQRMAFVKTFQTGIHGALSQKLLNEISAAKRCLLVPEKRLQYEQEIRCAQPPIALLTNDDAIAFAPSARLIGTSSTAAEVVVVRRRFRRRSKPRVVPFVLCLAAVVLLAVVVFVFRQRLGIGSPDQLDRKNSSSVPGSSVPGSSMPGSSMPGSSMPGASPPESIRPESNAPESKMPGSPAGGSLATSDDDAGPKSVSNSVGSATNTAELLANDILPSASSLATASATQTEIGPTDTSASESPAADGDSLPGSDSDPIPTTDESLDSRSELQPELEMSSASNLAETAGLAESAGLTESGERCAVPDSDTRAAQRAAIRELYRDDFAQGLKKPADKIALAHRMMVDAQALTDDPVTRYVLADEARQLALDGGDIAFGLRIVEELAGEYELDSLTARADNLRRALEHSTSPEQRKSILEWSLALLTEAHSRDRFDVGTEAIRIAELTAARMRDADSRKAVSHANREFQRHKREWEQLQAARETLQQSPDDPNANLLVGRDLCLHRNQWVEGLTFLTKATGSTWAAAAEADKARDDGAVAKFTAARNWESLAERQGPAERRKLLLRAQELYADSIDDLTGTDKILAGKRLEVLRSVAVNMHRAINVTTSSGAAIEVYAGLIGKVIVNGKDVGLLVRYDPHTRIQTRQLEKSLRDFGVNEMSQVVVELTGSISMREARSLYVRQEVRNDNATVAFAIAGKLVDRSKPKERTKSRTVSVSKGDHSVAWSVSGSAEGSLLRMQEQGSNLRIECYYTNDMLEKARRLNKSSGKAEFRREIDLSEP